MVDAVSGEVLHRENQVEHSSDVQQFQGEITADACGPKHPFELTDNKTQTITVAASAINVANDIVVKLYGPGNALLSSGDLATSPETLTYSPGGTIPQGIYQAEVCPFDDPTVPFAPPGTYAGVVATSDSGAEAPSPNLPRWRYFTANPSLDYSPDTTPKNTVVGCWVRGTGCTRPPAPSSSRYSAPWDYDHASKAPTLHHRGNNANDHEAWGNPLAPGGTAQAPFSPTREYLDAVHRRLEQLHVRPDPAASRRQRHQLRGHQPLRRAQPDARLQLRPRLHRAQLQPPAGQPRPEPRRRPARTTRRSATSRPAR